MKTAYFFLPVSTHHRRGGRRSDGLIVDRRALCWSVLNVLEGDVNRTIPFRFVVCFTAPNLLSSGERIKVVKLQPGHLPLHTIFDTK